MVHSSRFIGFSGLDRLSLSFVKISPNRIELWIIKALSQVFAHSVSLRKAWWNSFQLLPRLLNNIHSSSQSGVKRRIVGGYFHSPKGESPCALALTAFLFAQSCARLHCLMHLVYLISLLYVGVNSIILYMLQSQIQYQNKQWRALPENAIWMLLLIIPFHCH